MGTIKSSLLTSIFNTQLRRSEATLPPEVWSQIFWALPFNDVKLCRLVSQKFCCIATILVRKVNRLLVFRTEEKLQAFISLMRHSNPRAFPLSKFQFNWRTLSLGGLTEFAEKFGLHVRELRFLEPQDARKTEDFYCYYAKCLSTLFHIAPNLECLKLNVYDYKLPSQLEICYRPLFFQLRKLNIRVTPFFETGIEESIIQKLVQAAPCLDYINIHSGSPDSRIDSSDFLRKLPELFKHLSPRCTLGLPFLTLKDTVRGVMRDLTESKIRIHSVVIHDLGFKESDAFRQFWNWLATQPLKQLGIRKNQISIVDVISKGTLPVILESCEKLTLDNYSTHLFRREYFQFPNLSHVELATVTQEGLQELCTNFPQIHHLTCDCIVNAFSTLAGTVSLDALEIVLGVRTQDWIPLRQLTSLRVLDLGLAAKVDLVAVLYLSNRLILPRLEVLNLALYSISAQDIESYQRLLSVHHDRVLLKSNNHKKVVWWNRH